MERSTKYGLVIMLLVVSVGYFLTQVNADGVSAEDSIALKGGVTEAQEVVIGMKNYNYHPQEVKVKAGVPVSLSLDKSVYGCFRDFTIRELGVRKYLKSPSDIVEFTPTQKGRYTFACSMGMGTGTLVVE